METVLYKKRGGGRVVDPSMMALGSANSATWPLCSLALYDNHAEFKFNGKTKSLQYSDIDHIEIRRSGFIWFIAKDRADSFAFTWTGLAKIVGVLQEKQVPVAPDELSRLGFASAFVWAQVIFAVAFIATWLFMFFGIIIFSWLHN
jgi:hypothetical protein